MRRRLRFDRTTVFIAVAAVMLGIAYMGIAAWVNAQFADTVPSTSSLSTSSVGLKVWREYLDRIGVRTSLLTDFSSLPSTGTIVLAGSFENPPREQDAERLEKWVARGGHAVFVGLDDAGMGGAFDPPAAAVSGERESDVGVAFPGALSYGVGTIAPGEGRFEARSLDWVSIFEDANGATALMRTHGRGTVTWIADVAPVSNDGIGRLDNARFAVQLVGSSAQPVYFDEYHHGLTSQPGVWGAIGAGGRAALLLLVAAALVVLIARGRRLGPTIAVHELPAARGTAYIGQLAELFRRAGARDAALLRIEEGLIRSLARRYGDRASGLERQPDAAQAVARSAALRSRGAMTRDEFVAAARQLRAARKEVEGGNG